MATQMNIFNREWCELVFAQKNHNYGAYVIRQDSGKRHFLALFITLSLVTLSLTLPQFLKSRNGTIVKPEDRVHVISVIPIEPKIPTKEIIDFIKKIPRIFRPTIAYLPPLITEDENVTPEDTIPTNEIINNSPADISSITAIGDPTSNVKLDPESLNSTNTVEILTFVSQMPQFPGGDDELLKYLSKNIKYPRLAIENGVSDNVYVQFVVFASGEIGNVTVLRGNDESCKAEASRVIQKMGKWIPGKQNGKPVNVQMSVPVRFKLQE